MQRVTGHVERALLAADEPGSVPERVTRALVLFLGGDEATTAAREATVAQRRQLVREVLTEVDGARTWRTCRCDECGEPFDVHIDVAEFPTPEAPASGTVEVELSYGAATVRLLTGADEEAAVAGTDSETIARRLAARAVEPRGPLTDDDVVAVAAALERIGPPVVTELATSCPGCGHDVTISVDPFREVGRGDDELFEDVHGLAAAYGWSRDEILSLPTRERRRHVARVDAGRGVRS